ncbi:hypothetical protein AAMO2058_000594000 [Amorphochlora amoebiformis]
MSEKCVPGPEAVALIPWPTGDSRSEETPRRRRACCVQSEADGGHNIGVTSVSANVVEAKPPQCVEDKEKKVCRLCFDDDTQDSMIAPCSCSGGQKWIHRHCLNEWRSQENFPHAFSRCPTCKFEYVTREVTSKPTSTQMWTYFGLVVRDIVLALFGTIGAMWGMAGLVSILDPSPSRPLLHAFPHEWAMKHSSVFSIGPYLVTGVLLFLALLGLMGIVMAFLSIGERGAPVCGGCYFCDCIPLEIEAIPCLVICIIVLAVVGVFVGMVFAVWTCQFILRKHIKVLWMRGEADRILVVDLSKHPESMV